MYYLEEFESLVDELLFRLTALSNGLHHTLPPKLHHYLEEHSPVTSPIQEPSNTDTKVSHARVKRGEQTHACSALAHIHAPCMCVSSGKPTLFRHFVILLQEFARTQMKEETIRY